MNLLQSAKEYIEHGFSVIPITKTKTPNIQSWRKFQEELPRIEDIAPDLESAYGLALICGKVSGNIEALDIDCKYDLTGKMFKEFCEIVADNAPGLLQKMCVAKTMNGGYHFIYRLSGEVEGNKKLASRPATPSEAMLGDTVKVLFETRGERGYFAVAPTPGYEIKRGSMFDLKTITEDERATLFAFARHFSQMPVIPEPQEIKERKAQTTSNELSPFEDYNNRADIPALLKKHGWKQIYGRGDRIHFKRPGDTDSPIAANYDQRRRIFYVFSTSTVFDADKGYNPTQIFTILEHNRDYSAASKELFNQGFGKREKKIKVEYVERQPQKSNLYQWMKKYEEHKKENAI